MSITTPRNLNVLRCAVVHLQIFYNHLRSDFEDFLRLQPSSSSTFSKLSGSSRSKRRTAPTLPSFAAWRMSLPQNCGPFTGYLAVEDHSGAGFVLKKCKVYMLHVQIWFNCTWETSGVCHRTFSTTHKGSSCTMAALRVQKHLKRMFQSPMSSGHGSLSLNMCGNISWNPRV